MNESGRSQIPDRHSVDWDSILVLTVRLAAREEPTDAPKTLTELVDLFRADRTIGLPADLSGWPSSRQSIRMP